MGFITCVMACCTQVLAPTQQWTPQDEAARKRAYTHCREHVPPQTCLIRFKKVEDSIYTAICGKENN